MRIWGRKKILIAEDDSYLRELYGQRFSTEFNILFAKDGQEAIDKILDEKPDLVLLDIMMPKKSGMDVLKEMRKEPSVSETKVIILTVLPDADLKQEAESLNVRQYLVKSKVTPAEVIKIIKSELQ